MKLPFWPARGRLRTAVDVGWLIFEDKGSVIWDDPLPVRRPEPRPVSAKSVQVCPAAVDFDARHFVVPCPIDARVRVKLEPGAPAQLENVDGPRSPIRSKALGQMLHVISRAEWRHPDRPIVQIVTPYVFLSDEPVWINQLPPFLDFPKPPLPGTLICGRFPIHIWPRHLMWAFEWHDVQQDLVLRRGQPWFMLRFETHDPTTPVRLVEAEKTPELERYVASVSGVTNYVNRTYSLFDRARRRRPKRLLVPLR